MSRTLAGILASWRVEALLLALLALSGCRSTPPEEALRRDVAALASAIEARDASSVHEALADDFIGNDGLDREGARRAAALLFLADRSIGVTLGPLAVTLRGDRAQVDCSAALTGGTGRFLPDSGGLYDVRSGWRLEDGTWRVTSMEWTRR